MLNILALFLFPLLSSIVLLLLPQLSPKNLKRIALVASVVPLVILLGGFHWIGKEVNYAWLPTLGIRFHLVVDNLSFIFLFLTAVVIPFSILAVNSSITTSSHVFYALVLLLQSLLFGFFTSKDLVLFTIFWEAMLLPLYLIIMIWGGPNRHNAALKFIIYMIAGSTLMIAAVLFLYISSGSQGERTFNLDLLAKTSSGTTYASWIFGIFLLAFAVKTPLFPFHAWLADAYCEASTPGTILLSAILSKAGVYGILRIGYELFPDLIKMWSPLLLGLAVTGVFYGGLLAWRQNDFKRLIAYSSLSHVNFILAGLFAFSQMALAGGIFQALNHGIIIIGLFLVASWLEERLGSRTLKITGLCKYIPQLCWLTFFFILAAVALPGTNSFVGEFMIFLGLFGQNPWLTAFLGLSVVLSVIYMLRWMQNEYFGPQDPNPQIGRDIRARHLLIALPLVILILLLGIYPAPVLNFIKPAVEKITAFSGVEQLS